MRSPSKLADESDANVSQSIKGGALRTVESGGLADLGHGDLRDLAAKIVESRGVDLGALRVRVRVVPSALLAAVAHDQPISIILWT